jgi:hypothetical protein
LDACRLKEASSGVIGNHFVPFALSLREVFSERLFAHETYGSPELSYTAADLVEACERALAVSPPCLPALAGSQASFPITFSTHKHPKVRAWLARRPRWHIHFTPTYASWLNQVERFFAFITQRAIRRGSFDSTADLVKKIDHFIRTHNANSCPFVWTATADSILQKLARLCQRISGTEH